MPGPQPTPCRGQVTLSLLRDGTPLQARCATLRHDGAGTQRVVGWAGLLVQESPQAVLSQRAAPPSGV